MWECISKFCYYWWFLLNCVRRVLENNVKKYLGDDGVWERHEIMCHVLTPAGNWAPHSCSLLLPCSWWDGEKNWKKVKLMAWDQNHLIIKIKYNNNTVSNGKNDNKKRETKPKKSDKTMQFLTNRWHAQTVPEQWSTPPDPHLQIHTSSW